MSYRNCLRFDPLAWMKLLYFCHKGNTEIGGFGISEEHDLLYIVEFISVEQENTAVTVKFRDESVADHFDNCLDHGTVPNRCGRIWIHTHPGDSASPTGTDEMTFRQGFGDCDWAAMMILAKGGETYARLRLRTGPGIEVLLPVEVLWEDLPYRLETEDLKGLTDLWAEEFSDNIHPVPLWQPEKESEKNAPSGAAGVGDAASTTSTTSGATTSLSSPPSNSQLSGGWWGCDSLDEQDLRYFEEHYGYDSRDLFAVGNP
jgi:hypothetical protein